MTLYALRRLSVSAECTADAGRLCMCSVWCVFAQSPFRFDCRHVSLAHLCFEGLVTCRSLPSRLLQVSLSSKLARSVCGVLCVLRFWFVS